MWSKAKIKRAIAKYPHDAADALAAIQLDPTAKRIDPAALAVSAQQLNMKVEQLWVDALAGNRLLKSFAAALEARGVEIEKKRVLIDERELTVEDTNIDRTKFATFTGAASSFSCRIRRDGRNAGSGVLIGPTTVVTAWHVIAKARPSLPQEPWPRIEVVLSDGRKVRVHVPAAYHSMCSDEEYDDHFPENDRSVEGKHDVAVLRLAQPVGGMLGAARLPEAPIQCRARGSIVLLHYPEGRDVGIGVGAIRRIGSLKARWGHGIHTEGGSSGGGCFGSDLSLIGIHQGRDPSNGGRMVPTSYYLDQLRPIVANDEAPARMWSLDETPEGEFVIGRQDFFAAFAAARRNPRVRGIRVKRAKAAGDLSGLSFSYLMAERLTARSPEMRLMRISFEALVPDVANEIARRATGAGIPVGKIKPAPGVADGQSAPEAVGADRGREAAIRIDRIAGLRGLQAWVFIDHPAIAFGDEQRSTLEAFIDQSINLENIRLIIAGFEAVPLPGQEFYSIPNPNAEGGRGLLTEILEGFGRSDVRAFLILAANAAGVTLTDDRLDLMADRAIAGIENDGGIYPAWAAAQVVDQLRDPVARLF